MKTIKCIIILLCIIFTTCANAQKTIEFKYDAAGNRTDRFIKFKKSSEAATDSTLITKPITELLGEMEIKVYPNPTRGLLTVEITNMPDDISGEVAIYNLEGRLIQKQKVLTTGSSLDISVYPTGMYILRVQVGQNRSEWKIIKE